MLRFTAGFNVGVLLMMTAVVAAGQLPPRWLVPNVLITLIVSVIAMYEE